MNTPQHEQFGTDQDSVRAQYERFPYPTPEQDLEPWIKGERAGLNFPRLFFHRYWPHQPYRDDLDILIAGCGTAQAAQYAAAHPNCRVLGIDLSSASLAATRKLADQHGIDNLQLEQLPLERARELGEQRFDLVVSSGVIHHLPDPDAGLRALQHVTRPEGVLYLMVYAPHGRDAIYYLQALCRQLDIRPETISNEDLEALKRFLENLPPEHPLWHRRQLFPDLFNTAELVDYLLHPIDRAYTLEAFNAALESADLRLQGLLLRGHYEPMVTALADSPWGNDTCALPAPQRWYLGETCRASLFKHEVIACRHDRALSTATISADDEDWLGHIPTLAPALRRDFLNPPQGYAGVMSWPFHAFEGIRLPYTAQEGRWLGRMNGKNNLASVLDAGPSQPEALRDLVKRMEALDFLYLRSEQAA